MLYLTAKAGQCQYFISANYKLIKVLVEESGDFVSLTPSEFVSQYMDEAS